MRLRIIFFEIHKWKTICGAEGKEYSRATLQRQNTEISKQKFPEKEYRGLSHNFHIHASVSELYIPTIGLPILLEEICRPILGLYKSLTDTWMLKFGLRPCYSQKRNTELGFSLQCKTLCIPRLRGGEPTGGDGHLNPHHGNQHEHQHPLRAVPLDGRHTGEDRHGILEVAYTVKNFVFFCIKNTIAYHQEFHQPERNV